MTVVDDRPALAHDFDMCLFIWLMTLILCMTHVWTKNPPPDGFNSPGTKPVVLSCNHHAIMHHTHAWHGCAYAIIFSTQFS